MAALEVSIMWRRLDRPGHEIARLVETSGGAALEGTAIFLEGQQPCQLDYRIACDADWRTTAARISGRLGDTAVAVEIIADRRRTWMLNDVDCPTIQGCEDVDLSFSPATNLLPIRRLRLRVGQKAAIRAAWLRFPGFVLEPLEQIYERVGEWTYRYESGGGVFVTVLEVNEAGFVTGYPDLWCEERIR